MYKGDTDKERLKSRNTKIQEGDDGKYGCGNWQGYKKLLKIITTIQEYS
jgi:hypothetical protein